MESIVSLHNDVYPVKIKHKKLSIYSMRRHTFYRPTNPLRRFYRHIKTIFAQRTIYIFGVINLSLAIIALICVTHAEDHSEYFFLVYIAISIFIFYMLTIILIIIRQVIETYQERQRSSESMNTNSNNLIVECTENQTQPISRLARSQTVPITNLQPTISQSSSSSTLKEAHPLISTLSPTHHSSHTYRSFALTTNYPSLMSLNALRATQSGPLIKPIPLQCYINRSRQQLNDD